MESFDAIIAGAGPGGTAAAMALARREWHVLLLEAGNFPRHKVCGEFLSPESRDVLQRLELIARFQAAGAHEITTARFIAGPSTAEAKLPEPALALSRYAMDELLWHAAQASGAQCRPNEKVSSIQRQGDFFEVQTASGPLRARAVIDATGRARLTHTQENRSVVSDAPRFLGIKAHFRGVQLAGDVVELHFWRGGYCGLARVEGDAFNVCLLTAYPVAGEARESSGGKGSALDGLWQDVLARCPRLAERMASATAITPWQATANVRFTAYEPCGEGGIMRCGDAAGYIHALAGDGMAMALRSGELAAAVTHARLRGALGIEAASELYQAAWRREFEGRLVHADILSRMLLTPITASMMIKFFSCAPRLAERLVRSTRGRV